MTNETRWIEEIKSIRTRFGVGIADAERIALTDSRWHRWVTYRINNDPTCRLMARRHMRVFGDKALIFGVGEVLKVRRS